MPVELNCVRADKTENNEIHEIHDSNINSKICFIVAENLKTLFRPCAMVVPDIALICEIMLVAEGFQEARVLARKFITLYTLCKELLSHQVIFFVCLALFHIIY